MLLLMIQIRSFLPIVFIIIKKKCPVDNSNTRPRTSMMKLKCEHFCVNRVEAADWCLHNTHMKKPFWSIQSSVSLQIIHLYIYIFQFLCAGQWRTRLCHRMSPLSMAFINTHRLSARLVREVWIKGMSLLK